MTLLDLSEPLFQYICRLNRSARKGGNYEMTQVQVIIKDEACRSKSKSVPGENLRPMGQDRNSRSFSSWIS